MEGSLVQLPWFLYKFRLYLGVLLEKTACEQFLWINSYLRMGLGVAVRKAVQIFIFYFFQLQMERMWGLSFLNAGSNCWCLLLIVSVIAVLFPYCKTALVGLRDKLPLLAGTSTAASKNAAAEQSGHWALWLSSPEIICFAPSHGVSSSCFRPSWLPGFNLRACAFVHIHLTSTDTSVLLSSLRPSGRQWKAFYQN